LTDTKVAHGPKTSTTPTPRYAIERLTSRAAAACLAAVLALTALACRSISEGEFTQAHRDILAEIRNEGEASVMIALVEPPGFGDPDRAPEVRAAIARMQSTVIAALDTADFRPRQRFLAVPAFAGTIRSERGLRALLSNSNVRAVSLDRGGTGTK
jgi:hypothetical protein